MKVSIADAKPIPWRHFVRKMQAIDLNSFNRRREANPLATCISRLCGNLMQLFQSQTRSQSPGDTSLPVISTLTFDVSIADAKPIPWRRYPLKRQHLPQ